MTIERKPWPFPSPLNEKPAEPDHLQDDAPYVQCDKCGRKSWGSDHSRRCGFPQPSGDECDGVMRSV